MRTLNLFLWKLNDIEKILDKIKESSFDSIQISPLQIVSDNQIISWWNIYNICGYEIGNPLGNTTDLKELCEKANEKGIKVFSEIIPINVSNVDLPIENKICYELLCMNNLICINQVEKHKILQLLDKLGKCGLSGLILNYSPLFLKQEDKLFLEEVISLLQIHKMVPYSYIMNINEEKKRELLKYVVPITSYQDGENQLGVKYIESHYSFNNLNFGFTSIVPSSRISELYNELCDDYDDTVYYARPYDDEWMSNTVKFANQKIKKLH